ncbi:MAG TPA: hypothetical protein VLF91_00965 [Candidatus Saccharimonadales bacterium]|nr:hypothetical protein [Candidatus Saccharimonadales bacterium]
MPLRKKGRSESGPSGVETHHLELAREIHARAGALAAEAAISGDLLHAMDGIIRDLTEEERRKALLTHFQALPAEQRLEMLLHVFDDDAIRTVLAEERARAAKHQAFTGSVESLKADAKRYGRASLLEIPEDAVLELWMYDKDDYEEADSLQALDDDYYYEYYLRGTIAAGGLVHVLEQYTEYEEDAPFRTHRLTRLGTPIITPGKTKTDSFEPHIYIGTELGYIKGQNQLRMLGDKTDDTWVVGQVGISGTNLFE